MVKPGRAAPWVALALALPPGLAQAQAQPPPQAKAAGPDFGFPPIMSFSLHGTLPRYAIPPVISGESSDNATTITVTAARPAPRADYGVPAPVPTPLRLPRDDSTNPLAPTGCAPSFSNIGGQPASAADLAGAAGRGGC